MLSKKTVKSKLDLTHDCFVKLHSRSIRVATIQQWMGPGIIILAFLVVATLTAACLVIHKCKCPKKGAVYKTRRFSVRMAAAFRVKSPNTPGKVNSLQIWNCDKRTAKYICLRFRLYRQLRWIVLKATTSQIKWTQRDTWKRRQNLKAMMIIFVEQMQSKFRNLVKKCLIFSNV